jgi:hypothetical protein
MHELPIWFLVLSLFLPRIALFCAWQSPAWTMIFGTPWYWLGWILLPRVLVLVLISTYMGTGRWFWAHLVVAICVWLGGGSRVRQR